MRKIFSFLMVFVVIFFVACADNKQAPAQDSVSKIKERGHVIIGVFSDKPPFGYVDEAGKNQGYDIFLAKRIAKDLLGDENKVKYELVEAANRVEFLVSSKVDIILANFTKTPERAKVVDFAEPYMKVALGIVSPKDAQITDVAQLASQKLIVNKGTTADAYFSKNYPKIELVKFDQNTETFAAMTDGRGAALAHDNALLFAWVKENPNFKVGIQSLGDQDVIAPAVKKGDTALLNWLNDEIKKLKAEGFFDKAYEQTLRPVYSDDIDPKSVIF